MPHMVKHDITFGAVRKGDLLDKNDADMTVTNIDRKVTWTTITIGEGSRARTTRMRVDAPTTVYREEKTDEEKAADRHWYVVDSLRKQLKSMLGNTPASVLRAIMDKAGDDAVEILSWHNTPDVFKAQAMYKHAVDIRADIHHLADARQLPVDVNTPDDVANVPEDVLVDAFAWWLVKARRRDEYGARDPFSRSTSVISNMTDDVADWSVAEVIKNLSWTGGIDALRQRGDELQAEARAKNNQQ